MFMVINIFFLFDKLFIKFYIIIGYRYLLGQPRISGFRGVVKWISGLPKVPAASMGARYITRPLEPSCSMVKARALSVKSTHSSLVLPFDR